MHILTNSNNKVLSAIVIYVILPCIGGMVSTLLFLKYYKPKAQPHAIVATKNDSTFVLKVKDYHFEESSNGATITCISPFSVEDSDTGINYYGNLSLKGKHRVKSIKITVEEQSK